jgi:hypothetical protein
VSMNLVPPLLLVPAMPALTVTLTVTLALVRMVLAAGLVLRRPTAVPASTTSATAGPHSLPTKSIQAVCPTARILMTPTGTTRTSAGSVRTAVSAVPTTRHRCRRDLSTAVAAVTPARSGGRDGSFRGWCSVATATARPLVPSSRLTRRRWLTPRS